MDTVERPLRSVPASNRRPHPPPPAHGRGRAAHYRSPVRSGVGADPDHPHPARRTRPAPPPGRHPRLPGTLGVPVHVDADPARRSPHHRRRWTPRWPDCGLELDPARHPPIDGEPATIERRPAGPGRRHGRLRGAAPAGDRPGRYREDHRHAHPRHRVDQQRRHHPRTRPLSRRCRTTPAPTRPQRRRGEPGQDGVGHQPPKPSARSAPTRW